VSVPYKEGSGEEGLTYTQVVEKIRFEQAVLWL
jgi:hypothetical protein